MITAINWDKVREGNILFYGKYSIPRVVEEIGTSGIVLEAERSYTPRSRKFGTILTISKGSRKFYKKYPSHSLKCTNALVSPEGVMYPCPFARHSDLARILDEMFGWDYRDPSQELEKLGWIKLSIDHTGWYQWLPEDTQYTQPQIDTIFDWCKNNHAQLPRFLREVKHESK